MSSSEKPKLVDVVRGLGSMKGSALASAEPLRPSPQSVRAARNLVGGFASPEVRVSRLASKLEVLRQVDAKPVARVVGTASKPPKRVPASAGRR